MNAVSPVPANYLVSLLTGQPQLATSQVAQLNALRAAAVERVSVLTVPTVRDEDWRFTDISPLTKIPFHPVRSATSLGSADIEPFYIKEAANRLVFIDGVYSPQFSLTNPGYGVVVTNLAARVASCGAHLGHYAKFENNAFTALNTAFLLDGALITVSRDIAVAAPIHLLFVATQKEAATYPRCLVLAEPGSTVTIFEDYVALQEGAYFTNAVTEIVLADSARVNHIRVQREGSQAFHIANCAVSLARAADYQSVSVALGARISRYNLNASLADGAKCVVDGLALIAGQQLADTHTCIDHAQPHGVSRQLHKCIAGGSAHAVFNGKIMVRQGAQQTDSQQSSRTLLLTGRAHVDTKPQLEIFADDVKCTHGATVGQLDSEEVFYLRSRGLSDSAARNLLIYAFGAEIIERIPIASLKRRLEQAVLEQTSGNS